MEKTKDNETCSYTDKLEKIIAYAHGNLNESEEKTVAEHVHQCPECLDTVLRVRYAETKSKEVAPATVQLPNDILQMIEGNPVVKQVEETTTKRETATGDVKPDKNDKEQIETIKKIFFLAQLDKIIKMAQMRQAMKAMAYVFVAVLAMGIVYKAGVNLPFKPERPENTSVPSLVPAPSGVNTPSQPVMPAPGVSPNVSPSGSNSQAQGEVFNPQTPLGNIEKQPDWMKTEYWKNLPADQALAEIKKLDTSQLEKVLNKEIMPDDLLKGQACYQLGINYRDGINGASKDLDKAKEYFRNGAEKGHEKAGDELDKLDKPEEKSTAN